MCQCPFTSSYKPQAGLLLCSCGELGCRQSAQTSCQPRPAFYLRTLQTTCGATDEAGREEDRLPWGYNLGYQDKLSLLVDVHFPSDIPSGQGEQVVCVCVCVLVLQVLHLMDSIRASEVIAQEATVTGEPTRRHIRTHCLLHTTPCYTGHTTHAS